MTVDRASIRNELAAAPQRARALGARAGDPGAGEWSAREVVLHLAAVDEVVWQPRLDSLAVDAEPPRWAWLEPGMWSGPGDDTLDGALRAFAERRTATIARLERLDDAGWKRYGIHATFGRLDVGGLLRVLADHDEEHLAQLASLSG